MSDLIRMNASELVDAMNAGEVSSVEITQAHLDRISAVDSDVHAFLHVDAQGALATAAVQTLAAPSVNQPQLLELLE